MKKQFLLLTLFINPLIEAKTVFVWGKTVEILENPLIPDPEKLTEIVLMEMKNFSIPLDKLPVKQQVISALASSCWVILGAVSFKALVQSCSSYKITLNPVLIATIISAIIVAPHQIKYLKHMAQSLDKKLITLVIKNDSDALNAYLDQLQKTQAKKPRTAPLELLKKRLSITLYLINELNQTDQYPILATIENALFFMLDRVQQSIETIQSS